MGVMGDSNSIHMTIEEGEMRQRSSAIRNSSHMNK